MTTDLNFNSSTTETLRGISYDITQTATAAPTTVNLDFTLPVNIASDNVTGTGNAVSSFTATQTDNFSIMNLNSLSVNDGSVTFNGAILNNNGTMDALYGTIDINTKVLGGTGMSFIGESSQVQVHGLVGSGQTFELSKGSDIFNSNLRIDNPSTFFGHIEVGDGGSAYLVGLAATSYDYSNDVLTLWNGNKIADRLDVSGDSFTVYRNSTHTPTGIGIATSFNLHNDEGYVALPLHTGV